ncbi:MAG TPA: hypothetical protein VLA93_00315 [Pyrinomonadaceae bacterium]|nr:hypothetical protein [Pyrinomonadaceae bacterium]
MRRRWRIALPLFFILCVALVFLPATRSSAVVKTEHYSAMALLPAGAGVRMVGPGTTASVDIYIERYTTDDEAQRFAQLLIEGGSDSLHNALEKADSIGKVRLTRKVGFFNLKLIRARQTESGRRIIGVCDRPIQFLEVYAGNRSTDYPFGIVVLDLKTNKKGKEEGVGQLIYAAKVKIENRTVDVETYGVEPARLQAVRKL